MKWCRVVFWARGKLVCAGGGGRGSPPKEWGGGSGNGAPVTENRFNGSSTLFATIYDLFQGPVTGAKEGGGVRERGSNEPPPAQANFPPPL